MAVAGQHGGDFAAMLGTVIGYVHDHLPEFVDVDPPVRPLPAVLPLEIGLLKPGQEPFRRTLQLDPGRSDGLHVREPGRVQGLVGSPEPPQNANQYFWALIKCTSVSRTEPRPAVPSLSHCSCVRPADASITRWVAESPYA